MIDNDKKIAIPLDELKFIKPDVRMKLFKEIYTEYTKRYPSMKMIYANLNHDATVMVDYCLIFKAKNNDGFGDLILFDVPPIHSNRSTPGYRYYRRTKQEDNFYESGVDEIIIMELNKFYEFITLNLELSLDKKSPKYWKSPDNSSILLKGLLDMSFRYNKKM